MKPKVGRGRRVAVRLGVACLGLVAVWLVLGQLGLVPQWPLSPRQPELRATLKIGGPVSSVAFSPDGNTLASAGGLSTAAAGTAGKDYTIRLWDVATGQERATLQGHTEAVCSVAYSPDGKTLASGSGDGTIRLWDVATGQGRATLQGHPKAVCSVAYSPDGRTLASGSTDHTIRLWDAATGQERATLTGHEHEVSSVAYSPDGETLASGSYDGTIRLWDVATGQERATLRVHTPAALTLRGHTSAVHSVSYSADGTTLASGSWPAPVGLWDVATGQERAALTGHERSVNSVVDIPAVCSVAYSPDGKTLASGDAGGRIKLWDVATGNERASLKHPSQVNSVAFSPDGKTLASGSTDSTIKLWDLPAVKMKDK
jgi:WD40 repeat protein